MHAFSSMHRHMQAHTKVPRNNSYSFTWHVLSFSFYSIFNHSITSHIPSRIIFSPPPLSWGAGPSDILSVKGEEACTESHSPNGRAHCPLSCQTWGSILMRHWTLQNRPFHTPRIFVLLRSLGLGQLFLRRWLYLPDTYPLGKLVWLKNWSFWVISKGTHKLFQIDIFRDVFCFLLTIKKKKNVCVHKK